jgi:glycerol uptake facilitator-like aquaporin
LSSFFS